MILEDRIGCRLHIGARRHGTSHEVRDALIRRVYDAHDGARVRFARVLWYSDGEVRVVDNWGPGDKQIAERGWLRTEFTVDVFPQRIVITGKRNLEASFVGDAGAGAHIQDHDTDDTLPLLGDTRWEDVRRYLERAMWGRSYEG